MAEFLWWHTPQGQAVFERWEAKVIEANKVYLMPGCALPCDIGPDNSVLDSPTGDPNIDILLSEATVAAYNIEQMRRHHGKASWRTEQAIQFLKDRKQALDKQRQLS